MKSVRFFRSTLLCVAMLSGSLVVHAAENLGAVKARMEQRIAPLNVLKDRGVAGENNQGFLEVRGGATGDDQRVIGEENADRRTVYAAIAAQTGATPDAVGRQRAQQIAEIARRGHWIQDSSGAWRQK
ncbi:MAG: YdbL family protein [Opitutaceae bacterium]